MTEPMEQAETEKLAPELDEGLDGGLDGELDDEALDRSGGMRACPLCIPTR